MDDTSQKSHDGQPDPSVSKPVDSKPTESDIDIGLTSGQLMLAFQLGIFLPILGPLVAIAIGAMNRQTKDGRMIMLGGLGLILLQLATILLVWGYIASRPIAGPIN
ncbi:MAG: hypothetical protein H7A35_13945 [Planctomycetales bacterium]|nr:hypothetical protein [bacterium]UNM07943.1 MAG: hypothetical protein H7A35_13945 [Planctomycetales bacterium]